MEKEITVRVVMATGDNERTARAVAQKLGIDEVEAGIEPQRKNERVRKLLEAGLRKKPLQSRIEREIQRSFNPVQGEIRMSRIKHAICFLWDNHARNQQSSGGLRLEPFVSCFPA
jgi:magnesium-transporting ATPase (P-type)